MLDRAKVMQSLETVSEKLFVDFSHEYESARLVWERICKDPSFVYKAREAQTPWLIPSWQGVLNTSIAISLPNSYGVFAVDGSQIYPDRHQGTSCFLINIGTVTLWYGVPGKRVTMHTNPTVFSDYDTDDEQLLAVGAELVNCRRQEFEFKAGLEQARLIAQDPVAVPYVFLFDGSLIFWHLDTKDVQLKQTFLTCYITLLHQLYEQQVLCAGYISLPKSKELVNLVRVGLLQDHPTQPDAYKRVDHVLDTGIASFFLEPHTRSLVFKNNSSISDHYPDHLRPHFFYMHVGHEIGRVEIPAWIAADEEKVDTIAQILLDQSVKGNGYPVALAEAHEQAVVKGPDRDFFYHLISKVGLEQKRHNAVSQKSRKKRGIQI